MGRLSRLSEEDWNTLKKMLHQKNIRIMSVNILTTRINSGMNEFDNRLFTAFNNMLVVIATRDYEQ